MKTTKDELEENIVNYKANKFLKELLEAKNASQLRHKLMKFIIKLAEEEKVYYSQIDEEIY